MNIKNKEGYSDLTAHKALTKIEQEEKQAKKVKKVLMDICELSGYQLNGQISLIDKKTGHMYRL